MAENRQQEIIILKGRLKMKVIFKTSEATNEEYYYVPMEVSEMEKNGQKIDNQIDSIMLIFWKKDFDPRNQTVISNLKENQLITVHGKVGGRDNGLLRVVEFETEDSEEDVFI